MTKPLNILCTRELSEAELQQCNDAGLQVRAFSFINIEPNTNYTEAAEVLKSVQPQAIIATSKNAVPFIKETLNNLESEISNLKFYAVGQHTGNALNEFAENVTIAKSQNGTALAEQIVEEGIKKAVYFCSNIRRDELPDILTESGVELTEIVAYDTRLTPEKLDAAKLDGILFYSPSAVESFVSANGVVDVPCFAIGPTSGSALIEAGFDTVMMAEEPNIKQLINTILDYYTIADEVAE